MKQICAYVCQSWLRSPLRVFDVDIDHIVHPHRGQECSLPFVLARLTIFVFDEI
jgi:hypothetical protein